MIPTINRRDFIKRATVAGAGLAVAGAPARAPGANARVRIGVIGAGRMGMGNLEDFAKQPDAEIAGVCDVYQPNLDAAAKAANGKAEAYKDYRRILDRKDIDAVIVAAPDHWHALLTVEASKAGKDVYVEKPICCVVEEGKRMVEAARKYQRVVQVGTQQRSGIHFQKAVELVQNGFIGKVSLFRRGNTATKIPGASANPPPPNPPSPPTGTWC